MPDFPPSISRAAAIALIAASGLPAAQAAEGMRGTHGLLPLPFAASNAGGQAIACSVATAHWYTVELGTAAPRAAVTRTFWVAPATGTVFILNAHRDRMPVEQVWCGLAGRSWETRALLDLDVRAGHRPRPLRVTCRPDAAPLRCDVVPKG